MRIHAVQTGGVRIRPAQVAGRGIGPLRQAAIFADRDWTDWLPTYAWVIEHPEGVIVVDTGQGAHLVAERPLHPFLRWAVQFRIDPEDEIGPQLRRLGIGPRDVAQVVLTHLHSDHDAGLAHVAGARVRVARGEVRRARGAMGWLRGYQPARWPAGFAPEPLDLHDGPFGPFAAHARLTRAGDVVAVATPGHTPDHLSVIVQDGALTVFLAGDASYTEAAMRAGKVDGVSPDAGMARDTLGRIARFAATRPVVYLPTHDPGSARRLAQGQTVMPA